MPINNNHEIIKITVHHTNGDIDILNVYNLPKTLINVQAYNELITNRNTILFGDFNALNIMWQAYHTNINGRLLKQYLNTNNLCLLNDATIHAMVLMAVLIF